MRITKLSSLRELEQTERTAHSDSIRLSADTSDRVVDDETLEMTAAGFEDDFESITQLFYYIVNANETKLLIVGRMYPSARNRILASEDVVRVGSVPDPAEGVVN
jgi:hypothetical protein